MSASDSLKYLLLMKNINSILIYSGVVFLLMLLPIQSQCQNKKDGKKVVNVNKLDVIYQDEDDEYQGVVIDHSAKKSSNIPSTLVMPEEEEDEELSQSSQLYQPEQMGDGVESEFDILYASMDYEVIHYAGNSEIPDSLLIHLTDKSKGRKFCFPTPEHARQSSHYGARKRRWHYGVDLALPTGEPIFAAFDGIVRISKYNKSYGNLVVIRHFNGLETYYAHLSERDVNPGDTVRAGHVIGLCGNTGRSYGSHLHFEIRYMGKAINPEYVIDCKNHVLYSDELVLTPAYFRKVGSSHSSPSEATLRSINSRVGTAANDNETVAQSQPKSSAKPAKDNKPVPPANTKKYYKVRSGDNLSKIAKRNGTTVRKLCQLNGIKETSILQIGQRLRVR